MLFSDINQFNKRTELNNFAALDNAFTDDELDIIRKYCKTIPMDEGRVGAKENLGLNHHIRKSKIGWIIANDGNKWLFERLLQVGDHLNSNFFNFSLYGTDNIQYTSYKANNSKYDVHIDYCTNYNNPLIVRKLSLVLFLSDPSEYEGGQFLIGGRTADFVEVEQKKGRIIAFPSFTLHGVKPVTKGKRKTLVMWIEGPPFQ